jgi:hypothetical protein
LIVTDFLDEKRKEITARLAELKPLVDEHSRLQAAVSALGRLGRSASAATTAAPRRRGPGRPRGAASSASAATPAKAKATRKKRGRPKKVGRPAGAKKVGRPPGAKKVGRPPVSGKTAATTTKRRAGRRKGSGTRALEAHSLVQGQPGITIPELAAKMNIKQNYLYRVLPGLEQEGKVTKKGRGWHPKA